VVGSAKNGPILKAVATLCVAVVGLLSFVVLVQTVWAQLPVFPATSNRIQRAVIGANDMGSQAGNSQRMTASAASTVEGYQHEQR
jgi:hypothetical protein